MRRFARHLLWLVPLLTIDVYIAIRLMPRKPSSAQPVPVPEAPHPDAALSRLCFPTDQTNLLTDVLEEVYQPTAAGRYESALYGSARNGTRGGQVSAVFHEGIDIAPLRRDRNGRALDMVHAVADGTVAYINRVAGNSNYGIYVVLLHDDPVGPVYSLYAHLAALEPELREGRAVSGGERIGKMGATPASIIRAGGDHLHLEIGLVANRRFERWYRANKLVPDHGRYHGWNLIGIDPLKVYRAHQDREHLTMADLLEEQQPAFEVVLAVKQVPDFWLQYPSLWRGGAWAGGPIVVAAGEAGLPFWGRNATDDEAAMLGASRVRVVRVDEEQLGRNGARMVQRARGGWQLGSGGEQWLNILTY